MTLRRRGRAGSEGARPVADFWGWWAATGRAAAEAGIGGAGFEGFTGEMTTRVEAMHPDLAWELAPGGQAEHALVVTADGSGVTLIEMDEESLEPNIASLA